MEPPSSLLILAASISLILIGLRGLRFKSSPDGEYPLQDLEKFAGRHGTYKNFLYGISSIWTGKHRTLRTHALLTAIGLCMLVILSITRLFYES
ncbi:hypothetical protein [Rubritalea tangerina]|uniref:Uncharacterized protein n=1 Tax=Rubritalea tangerina TaxID=430798 RepID=A0ABW4ZGN1_9BACT